jgi:hypothetical protein
LEIPGAKKIVRQEMHGSDLLATHGAFKLYRITTREEAMKLGDDRWCVCYDHTASYFNSYIARGWLYLIHHSVRGIRSLSLQSLALWPFFPQQ